MAPVSTDMPVNDWLQRHELQGYAEDVHNSGATKLKCFLETLLSEKDVVECIPSIATRKLHLKKYCTFTFICCLLHRCFIGLFAEAPFLLQVHQVFE